MLGVADFPVEVLKLLRIKPSDTPTEEGSRSPRLSAEKRTASSTHTPVPTASGEDSVLSPNSSRSSIVQLSEAEQFQSRDVEGNMAEAATATEDAVVEDTDAIVPVSKTQSGHRCSLGNALSHARRRSSDGRSSPDPNAKNLRRAHTGNSQAQQMSLEAAVGAGRGIGRIVGAGLKSPMDFTLSLARGFHNAPKLYGDESVRQADKVTGIQSGLKAAGKVGLTVPCPFSC